MNDRLPVVRWEGPGVIKEGHAPCGPMDLGVDRAVDRIAEGSAPQSQNPIIPS